VSRANCDIVVQAKAHGPLRLGMMPRGPHSAECRLYSAAHDKIGRGHDCTGGPPRSYQTVRADYRIRIEAGIAACRDYRSQGFKIMRAVHSQKLRFGYLRSIDMIEHIEEPGYDKLVFYCRKTPGIFRVAFAGVVFSAIGVTNVRRAQCGIPVVWPVLLSGVIGHDTNRNMG
jgi:hypothetical protein